MIEYTVVYDVTREKANMGPLVALVLGALGTWILALKHGQSRRDVLTVIAFGVAWCAGSGALFLIETRHLAHCKALSSSAFAHNDTGIVEAFQPMPASGHGVECFSVNGRRFCYSDFDARLCGFRQSHYSEGPIRAGLPVRIRYLDYSILRLEIGSVASARSERLK